MSGCFSCVLIGKGSLLVNCVQQLRDEGHQVIALISSDTELYSWADANQIPVIDDKIDVYRDKLKSLNFDYLFSVVHLDIIPADVLGMAGKLSINYHDALLPRYAGIHATSWAIVNRETSHGITWHEMLPGVDEGRILSQRYIDIDKEETAFSLNLKCYEAAIASFAELIGALAKDEVEFLEQDLSQRTYFAKYKRPANLGVIQWNQPAEAIQAFVRGLNFSTYDNPLAKAKLVFDGVFYCVEEVEITSRRSDEKAGVMVKSPASDIYISTSTYDLALRRISHLNGAFIGLDDFAKLIGDPTLLAFAATEEQQNAYLKSARSEAFWVDRFHGFDAGIAFSNIHLGQPHRRLEWDVPDSLLNAMEHFGERYLLSLFCAFISRFRKSNQYCVGVNAGRLPINSYYLNRLPVTWSVTSNGNFNELCAEIERQCQAFESHRFCPVDIFNRYESLDSNRVHGIHYKYELSFEISESIHGESDFDPVTPTHGSVLCLDKTAGKWHLYIGAEADHDLAKGLEHKFNAFAEELTSNKDLADTPLTGFNLLSLEEQALLRDMNARSAQYPDLSTCELFYQQAQSHPNAIAVETENVSLTYAELRGKVEMLAGYLIKSGVSKGDRVGVLLERSYDMVAALLAVMRANAVYIPLDPIYPVDRLQHMVDDSGIKVLISQSSINSSLEKDNYHEVLVDTQLPDMIGLDAGNVAFPQPGDSAYIIYTSGSTGKPKGVEVTHRGLTNFLYSMSREPGITASDHLLSVTTVCFDIAALELYLPLITGARLEICSARDAKDGFALLEKLEKGDITILQATPTTWEMLLAAGWDKPLRLKALCGGEPLRKELASRLIPLCKELWNMYGPTETTIWSSIKRIVDAGQITVGKPIANTTMYVLDDYLNPVSASEKGELYIGGDGLARGYWQRAELTAEKFISNPFSDNPRDRLYRTGDAACYLRTGEFVCLGRIDNQIKLNGYRIELGEIETAIESFTGIEKAVVAMDTVESASTLHAFILHDDSLHQPVRERISKYLSSLLPEYMIPEHYHRVSEFPLTLNGKVDRNALMDSIPDILPSTAANTQNNAPADVVPVVDADELELDSNTRNQFVSLLKKDFTELVANIAGKKTPDTKQPFGQYGFNSLRFTMLSTALKKAFGIKLSPATYYSHDTIDKVCEYLVESKSRDQLLDHYQERLQLSSGGERKNSLADQTKLSSTLAKPKNDSVEREPIAIVGMAVKMPLAEDANQFWNNLKAGTDCITEIPLTRWNWRDTPYASSDNPFRWGGFIPDVGCFDAGFFSISPREAELMDPQQRLFLQAAYHAIEDAGHNPESLSGSNMGVYVGIVTSDYWDLLQHQGAKPDGYTISGNINCVVANRVSYQFNFKGPSAVIDTACSSSLVAMHRAVKAIQSGECEGAIVGGVNVIASDYIHHSFSKNGMLSKDGRCMSFDARANGYVRSEGVVALLLKPLSRAQADGDRIYATVLGSAENHGGRTNSLSAPSGEAQAELIIKAVEDANIDVNSLGYIEAHGSGTPLGDPIEIEGIQRAFATLRKKSKLQRHRCGIGSVKSNIGHLEAVAGLAGITKMLLAFRHGELPGMPMFETQNKHIDLDDSGLYFVHQNQPWLSNSGDANALPRRAGVSSFGFGGVNAHIILEAGSGVSNQSDRQGKNLLLISARGATQLRKLAEAYLAYLNVASAGDWQGICYTSQVGRQHFDERLLIEAENTEQGRELLNAFLYRSETSENVHQANVRDATESCKLIFGNFNAVELVEPLLEKRAIGSLGRLWLAGIKIDWRLYYGDLTPQRQALPLYPFQKTHYWLPVAYAAKSKTALVNKESLHPLIDTRVAGQRRFDKFLQLEDPLIGDHIVDDKIIFPAVGYLEFARAAGDILAAGGGKDRVVSLKGNVWFHALVVDNNPRRLNISLEGELPQLEYSIRSVSGTSEQLHARGSLEVARQAPEPRIVDTAAIAARCEHKLDHSTIYKLFGRLSFNYKDGYKPLRHIVYNSREALAQIELPLKFLAGYDDFILHPSLLEGGIQTVIGILANPDQDCENAYLPFSMKTLIIHGRLEKECLVHAVITSDAASAARGIRKFDIQITDVSGRVLVEIQEYVLKTLDSNEQRKRETVSTDDRSYGEYRKRWQAKAALLEKPLASNVLVFADSADNLKRFAQTVEGSAELVGVIAGSEYRAFDAPGHFVLNPREEDHLQRLFQDLSASNRLPASIIYAWGFTAEHAVPADVVDSVFKPFYYLCSQIARQPVGGVRRLLYTYDLNSQYAPLHAGISGLLKSLHQEVSKLKSSVVGVSGDLDAHMPQLLAELNADTLPVEIRYSGNTRQVAVFDHVQTFRLDAAEASALKPGATYLLTGGTGGIGRKLVQQLHQKYSAKIIILGRRSLPPEVIAEWSGINYEFHETDITDGKKLEALVEEISGRENIKGVIHCAGGIADAFISKKLPSDTDPVIIPKVLGLYTLDFATRDCPLDFFCVFSSISSVMGNMGQTDYGYANAVADEFSHDRIALTKQGLRHGKSVSVNWPLWRDGGMSASDAAIRFFSEATGVEPLQSAEGLRLLEKALLDLDGSCLLAAGDSDKVLKVLSQRSGTASGGDIVGSTTQKPGSVVDTAGDNPQRQVLVLDKLRQLAADILKLDRNSIGPDASMSHMGFDSISNTELASAVNEFYGTDITPIIFFEYSSLAEVAEYLQREFPQAIGRIAENEEPVTVLAENDQSFNKGSGDAGINESSQLLGGELRRIASAIIKVDPETIGLKDNLSQHGFDSISNTEFASEINQKYGTDITPIVFFEYHSLHDIAAHLIEEYPREFTSRQQTASSGCNAAPATSSAPETPVARFQQTQAVVETKSADIAIVGMHGIMPGCDSLEEFWTRLWDGADFVSEIPEDRWSWRQNYGDASIDAGKTRSKWGAFLTEVDKFDAEFFGLDEKEAALLDPQQRLFIQLVWHAIENAGYKASALAGTRTGLYVGLSNRDYADYLQQLGVPVSPEMSFGNNHAFLVNRISYLFDFAGPSESVDTLCSSSLVAVHRAVQDIRNGTCDQAIVGGISVVMSPKLSSVFEQAKMLSADGRCKSFDADADGFVRGEGGAALMIKPLTQAEKDGDRVLGVIKGSHVNHGGRANALTAPNLKAQFQLLKDAYERADIHPATISYVEAHGTGTKLGDPIEISALKKAFNQWQQTDSGVEKPACAIGTVKTNIGHLESASGIASIVKVLLSLEHKKLPRMIHLQKPNPYLDFKQSSLYLLENNQDWAALKDRHGQPLPRRAGINAFGAGGVNAHVILEEYNQSAHSDLIPDEPSLIVLSAKTESALRDYVRILLEGLRGKSWKLRDIAYTLQVGREELAHRLGIIAADIQTLTRRLTAFAEKESQFDANYAIAQNETSITESQKASALASSDLEALKSYWLAGESLEWQQLYRVAPAKKIALPGYPFKRVRYWVEPRKNTSIAQPPTVIDTPTKRTESSLPLTHFDFTQGDVYLADHKVFDDEVLLGVTYPSLALEHARSHSRWRNANRLSRVLFHNPLILLKDETARVVVKMTERNDGIGFETFHQVRGNLKTDKSASGSISHVRFDSRKIPLGNLVGRLTESHAGEEVYALLRRQGVDYQRSLKTVRTILIGEDMAIGQVHLNPLLAENTPDLYLHPVWLDAAVVCAKFAFLRDPSMVYIPFSINDVIIHRRYEKATAYCVVNKVILNDQILKCDLVICDSQGEVAVEGRGLTCKRLQDAEIWQKTTRNKEVNY